MKSTNSIRQDGKDRNLNLIFNTIAKCQNISRIDIANRIGMSASAVSGFTDALLFKRLILEGGSIESGEVGRRAIMLRVNPFGGLFICVLFKAGKIQLDLFNLERKFVFSKAIKVRGASVSGLTIINAIEDEIQYNYKYGKLFGIMLIKPSWYQTEGNDELLKQEFGYTIESDCIAKVTSFYRNSLVMEEQSTLLDAYCLVHDEFGGKNVLCLSIDNNIYSSVILNGQIYDHSFSNQEFGYIGVNYDDTELSEPDKKGILSSFVSINSICARISKIKGRKIEFSEVLNLYLAKDAQTCEVLYNVADVLAYAISSYIDILGIETVIIRGGFSNFGKDYCDYIFDRLRKYCRGGDLTLLKFADKGNSVMQGGAYLLFDKVFSV